MSKRPGSNCQGRLLGTGGAHLCHGGFALQYLEDAVLFQGTESVIARPCEQARERRAGLDKAVNLWGHALHDLLREQRRWLDLPQDSPLGTSDPPF